MAPPWQVRDGFAGPDGARSFDPAAPMVSCPSPGKQGCQRMARDLHRARRRPWDLRLPALLFPLLGVIVGCADGGLVAGLSGEVRLENGIEAELGQAVRPAPERFAFQDAMAWQFIGPSMESAARSLRDGHLPLWEPAIGGGWPLMASGSAGVLSPLKLPFYLLGGPAGESAWLLLKLLAAGLFTWLFCRRLGAGAWPAALGAVAFGACGYSVCYAPYEHDPVVFLPLALWSADRVLESRGVGRVAVAAASIALVLVSGHPVLAAAVLLATATWVLCRLWERRAAFGERLASGSRVLAAVLVALALSAVVLVPFAEFVAHGWSYKMATDREVPEATVERTPPFGLRRAAATVVPHLVEAWRGSDLPGGAGLFREFRTPDGPRRQYRSFLYAYLTWVGVVPLLLAGFLAFCRPVHPLLPFTLVPALMLFAFPGTALLAHVPFLSALLPRWFASWFCLGLAAMGAMGLQALLREPAKVPRRLAIASATYSVLAVAVAGLTALASADAGPEWGPPPGFQAALDRLLVPLAIAVLVPLVAVLFRRSTRGLAVALVLVASADLALHGAWIPGSPPREAVMPEDVRARLELPPAQEPGERVAALGRAMAPDTALYYGLDDFQAVLPLFVDRYHRFMEIAVPELREVYPTAVVISAPNPWLDLASIGTYLAPSSWNFGRGSPEVVHEGPAVRVLHRPEALPRAYVVRQALASGSPDAAADRVRQDPVARRLLPVVEPGNLPGPWVDAPPPEVPTGPPPAATPPAARILRHDREEVAVEVAGAGPGLLVLTDVFYPGWEADVDGEPAAIVPVNVAFRGVVLGGDARLVTFRYRPGSFRLGLAVTLLGALALGIALVLARRRRGSAPPPHPLHLPPIESR